MARVWGLCMASPLLDNIRSGAQSMTGREVLAYAGACLFVAGLSLGLAVVWVLR